MDDVSSTDRGPRQTDNESQTGTGSPRSADAGTVEGDSMPSATGDLNINRSGSGGTGSGDADASMDEMLGGDAEASDQN